MIKNFIAKVDPQAFLKEIDLNSVDEIHLAGYLDRGEFYLDSHSRPTSPEVWKLFEQVIKEKPHIPFCLEWDDDIPPLQLIAGLSLLQSVKELKNLHQ